MCLTTLGEICGKGFCTHTHTEHPLYIPSAQCVSIPRITAGEALHPCTSKAGGVIIPEPLVTVILRKRKQRDRPLISVTCFEEMQRKGNY